MDSDIESSAQAAARKFTLINGMHVGGLVAAVCACIGDALYRLYTKDYAGIAAYWPVWGLVLWLAQSGFLYRAAVHRHQGMLFWTFVQTKAVHQAMEDAFADVKSGTLSPEEGLCQVQEYLQAAPKVWLRGRPANGDQP